MRSFAMTSEKTDFVSKDRISSLPEALICHILSFLPTEEAALTSVLSKKWRYLFAFTPNLEFDNSIIYLNPDVDNGKRCFTDFVDRVLDLHENYTVNRFSLKCRNGVDPVCVTRWILNVLEHGVSDLDLHYTAAAWNYVIPSKVFLSKSLVRLKMEDGFYSNFDVEDVFLPKLKTLHFDDVLLGNNDNCFVKLISGCPVLEELVMTHVYSDFWNRFVSSKTLKRLTLYCVDYDKNHQSVSFDTPNLLYLDYCDRIAKKYPKVNFQSLVEASIGLQITNDRCVRASNGVMVGNATNFLMGIRNVQILNLFGHTLQVLAYCCKPIPIFNNLIHLTIKTDRGLGWESLPALLKNSPNLETLVFKGLHHKDTTKCKVVDGCLCKYSDDIPTCLSSSPVKVLKILNFGELCDYYNYMEKQMEQAKYFLEKMPNLEEMILYYNTPIDENMIEVSKQLQMVPRVASANCNVQLISDNLTLSSTVSTNGTLLFKSAFPV